MLGANKSSGRRTQQPVQMAAAASSTAGVGPDSGGLSMTAMEAQFLRTLHREKERAGRGARGERTCWRPAGAGEATLCRAVRRCCAATIAVRCMRRRGRASKHSRRREECLAILPIGRAGRFAERSRRARAPAAAENENDVIRPIPAFGSRISDRAAAHTARKQALCAAGCGSACPRNCNGFSAPPQLCHLAAATLTSFAPRARRRTTAVRDATNT